ncbi:hypothetical protein HPP92_026912 [Vanilla planifolia]|uniref:Uncharacterized protein n=1 Tax=Vanilla planifolia TaxID=51239 RepID=A0A835PCP8_VANPL|nr:hypothetical protein HPP92_026912 [Vanilla planifolia]
MARRSRDRSKLGPKQSSPSRVKRQREHNSGLLEIDFSKVCLSSDFEGRYRGITFGYRPICQRRDTFSYYPYLFEDGHTIRRENSIEFYDFLPIKNDSSDTGECSRRDEDKAKQDKEEQQEEGGVPFIDFLAVGSMN